jgi:hypothetical protein
VDILSLYEDLLEENKRLNGEIIKEQGFIICLLKKVELKTMFK